ncbi:hypothetical protein FKM82_016514 [Ascaphus truei]
MVFAIIPFCGHIGILALVMAIAGLAMGCIETVSNIQLVKTYQQDSAVFLQVLYFFLGVGALLSPLIADPFLSDTNCIQSNLTQNGSQDLEHIRNSLIPHHPGNLSGFELPLHGPAVTRISYAFWIIAVINLPVPIAVFLLLYKQGMVPGCAKQLGSLLSADELAMETQKKGEGSDPNEAEPHEEKGHGVPVICCQSENFRGASFPFFAIHACAAVTLFMSDGIVIGVEVTFLFLLLSQYSTPGLFVGTAFLGLFLSSVFPSMVAYTEDILNYKGCATTVLVTGAAMGEMILQILVGMVIQTQGSYSFLVCGVSLASLALTLYLALMVFDNIHSRAVEEPSCRTPPLGREADPYQR